MRDLKGASVVITGASRGIGAAAAKAFAQSGAKVVLAARSKGSISALAEEINKAGGTAVAQPCDVSRAGDVVALMARAKKEFGSVDILINNAGIIQPIAPLSKADPEAWSRAIDVNLKGAFYGMRAALPYMQSQGGGVIITVSSGAAHNSLEGWSAYCSSKAGAAMLTECAAREAPKSIRVMGLSPGTVATDMQLMVKKSGVNPVSKLDWDVHVPAAWPAAALVWMCSDDAAEFAGQEVSLRDEGIRKRIGLT